MIRTLLAEERFPLIKKAADWKPIFAHIGNLTSVEPVSVRQKKDWIMKVFLMLLFEAENNRMYYRMRVIWIPIKYFNCPGMDFITNCSVMHLLIDS